MNKRILYIILICILIGIGSISLTVMIFRPSSKLIAISFSNELPNPNYKFYFSDTLNHSYLRKLRQGYGIDTLTSSIDSEIEKIKAILNWSSTQWKHNGNNKPSNPDALTILNEVKDGSQFRCVEYGILASASLNSIGISSRVLGLKTRDVEKVRKGAGHVVTEAFSKQFDKWIFIDPQFNVMPIKNGIPLNAIEFQNAIMNDRENIELMNINGKLSAVNSEHYLKWIGKYLFYFDVLFDQRIGNEPNYEKINGKSKMMLVPIGEKEPIIFQRNGKINYCIYTNSVKDLYRQPKS